MQIENTAQDAQYKCWLTPSEYEALRDVASDLSLRHEIVVRLGGEVGLRSFEIPQPRPMDVKDGLTNGDNDYFLHIRAGKDTRSETDGQSRDAWLPADLERDLLELRYQQDRDPAEPFIQVSERRVQQMVTEAAEEVAERIEDGADRPGTPENWRRVTSHDLRRYFAQTHLVRERRNPRVVMEIGGWSSMQSLEPYLRKPTPEVIAREMHGDASTGPLHRHKPLR